jgi:hypothetical protein
MILPAFAPIRENSHHEINDYLVARLLLDLVIGSLVPGGHNMNTKSSKRIIVIRLEG